VSLQEEGSKFFTLVLGSSQRVNEMRQVFQMLLSYWVWLKRDSYWKRGNKDAKESGQMAIRVMLRELIRLWPRVRGQGWEKAKIHEQLHVPDDNERNGAPQGSHTGPTEQNCIRLVKQPAKGTQQRAKVFDRQLGQRVSDAYIVDMAYARMSSRYGKTSHEMLSSLWGNQPVCPPKDPKEGYLWTPTSTNYPTSYPQHLVLIYFKQTKKLFSVEMIQFLIHHYAGEPASENPLIGPGGRQFHGRLFLSTEYKWAGTIFRGHADYRHNGPWYNWVMLRWA
jgi:hypothetical protein